MANVIEITQLSPTMKEGVLTDWAKNEGDLVRPGDVIAHIETDKAVMDLEAFDEGILLTKLVEKGTRLPVGTPIAITGNAGESITEILAKAKEKLNSMSSGGPPPVETPSTPPEQAKTQITEPVAKPTAISMPESAEIQSDTRLRISPLARKMAETGNVPVQKLKGSGPLGRIVKKDIEDYMARPSAFSGQPLSRSRDEIKPVSMMRQTIAQRLTDSKSNVPHFYLNRKINVTKLVALRVQINSDLSEGTADDPKTALKISVNDFIVKANALSLRDMPEVNTQWNESSIIYKGNVDIGVAVAIEDGLITPIVRNADKKNIFHISTEVKALADKARKRKLVPDDYTGGSFTISNLGMFDIDSFSAIINAPESALMAVGKTTTEPFYNEMSGNFEPTQVLTVTLSCDHRVVDGAKGAKYLQKFAFYLEHPTLLIA